MSDNSNDSYRRYKQYRNNRRRYKTEQIAFPIAVLIIIAICTKFWWLIVLGILAAIITKIWELIEQHKNNVPSESIVANQTDSNKEANFSMSNTSKPKSTDTGYINRNNQRNNGKTDHPGTDSMQWFYEMECLNCGHKYMANGTDIWQRKCPKCQGGKK